MFLATIGKRLMAAAALMIGLTAMADDPVKKADIAPEKLFAMQMGTWDADISLFLPNQDPKGLKSKAVETNVILGGWMISDFKGDFGGIEFLGHGQTGFDAKKGKYVGTWVDSMNPSMTMMEGTYDAAAKTLTLHANVEDPQSGKPMKMKFTSVIDPDKRTFTEFVQPEGAKEFTKLMEIVYTKRAK